jgi:hypothetical protein
MYNGWSVLDLYEINRYIYPAKRLALLTNFARNLLGAAYAQNFEPVIATLNIPTY